ncbi:hypothetical protein PLICRDRAFT_174278 [Plicaturopsis crispa FD-325 SS-3]|nr:hypothetical protein PLICRDRAFT_174278 [Plicaturopsis crispa FD-325 SS-3]
MPSQDSAPSFDLEETLAQLICSAYEHVGSWGAIPVVSVEVEWNSVWISRDNLVDLLSQVPNRRDHSPLDAAVNFNLVPVTCSACEHGSAGLSLRQFSVTDERTLLEALPSPQAHDVLSGQECTFYGPPALPGTMFDALRLTAKHALRFRRCLQAFTGHLHTSCVANSQLAFYPTLGTAIPVAQEYAVWPFNPAESLCHAICNASECDNARNHALGMSFEQLESKSGRTPILGHEFLVNLFHSGSDSTGLSPRQPSVTDGLSLLRFPPCFKLVISCAVEDAHHLGLPPLPTPSTTSSSTHKPLQSITRAILSL